METQMAGQSSLSVEKALTSNALSELKLLLGAVKGRTILLSNSINPDSPLQKHFDDMINYLNESLETTSFLTDSFDLDNLMNDTK